LFPEGLRNVDGVHGLTGKDLAVALDAVRGRALAIATRLAALAAVDDPFTLSVRRPSVGRRGRPGSPPPRRSWWR
jgi:hypothetical protein